MSRLLGNLQQLSAIFAFEACPLWILTSFIPARLSLESIPRLGIECMQGVFCIHMQAYTHKRANTLQAHFGSVLTRVW